MVKLGDKVTIPDDGREGTVVSIIDADNDDPIYMIHGMGWFKNVRSSRLVLPPVSPQTELPGVNVVTGDGGNDP